LPRRFLLTGYVLSQRQAPLNCCFTLDLPKGTAFFHSSLLVDVNNNVLVVTWKSRSKIITLSYFDVGRLCLGPDIGASKSIAKLQPCRVKTIDARRYGLRMPLVDHYFAKSFKLTPCGCLAVISHDKVQWFV
jgi:hypothetical protein